MLIKSYFLCMYDPNVKELASNYTHNFRMQYAKWRKRFSHSLSVTLNYPKASHVRCVLYEKKKVKFF